MATTIEAILGAVDIDGGTDGLEEVLLTLGLTYTFLEVVISIFSLSFCCGRTDLPLR